MSHFLVMVLVPGNTTNIEEAVSTLMAPYDENLEVEPYEGEDGTTTRNPRGKWDWWRIGGRWDGAVRNNPRSSENGFNFSSAHEELKNNVLPVKDLDHKLTAFAVVTPDGQWHEKGRMGWFGLAANEKDGDTWDEEVIRLMRSHQDCMIVGLDCHI